MTRTKIDLDVVLDHLAVERPDPDVEGLRTLYEAWCRRVPFDNLQKLIALAANLDVLPEMDAARFFDTTISVGTGGTCWASTNALHALLTAIGFDAQVWSASMFDGDANHATNIVTTGGDRWLVDTAVHGAIPLQIIDGEATAVDHHGYRTAIRHDERGAILDFPTPDPTFAIPCRILDPVDHEFTVHANERTRAWSPFNEAIMAGINDDTGVWMLSGANLTRVDGSGRTTRELTSAEVDEFLVDVVGCSTEVVAAARASLV